MTQISGKIKEPKIASPTAASRMTADVPGLELSGRTVIVASDRSVIAHAVARVAACLERVHGAIPTVLYVFDLSSYPVPPLLVEGLGAADELLGDEAHDEQRRDVTTHLAAVVPEATRWPVHVAAGAPAAQIVSYAERVNAALTVMGLRPHGRIERVIHDETTLRVLRHTVSPVLAVLEGASELPRRIIVGVDFSRASVAAARAALDIAAVGATLTLVHVEWPSDRAQAEEGETLVHEIGVAGALARVREYLSAQTPGARRIVIDSAVVRGSPSQELLAYAAAENADLIAVASRRYGSMKRLMLGSVTDEITRAAAVSLLVVPPPHG